MSLLIYYLHTLIPLSIILMPILSVEKLKYVFILPIMLPLTWIICGTCPINKFHKNESGKSFIQSIIKKITNIDVNISLTRNIITFSLLLSVIISALKIMVYHKVYNFSIRNNDIIKLF